MVKKNSKKTKVIELEFEASPIFLIQSESKLTPKELALELKKNLK